MRLAMLMSSSPYRGARVIAYCVLRSSQSNGEALGKLQKFCKSLKCESEIFAEEVSNIKKPGSFWLQIVKFIQNKKCHEVIVPDIHHVGSGDLFHMFQFFALLKKTNVRLRTLDGRIDSSRQSIEEIASISVASKALGRL